MRSRSSSCLGSVESLMAPPWYAEYLEAVAGERQHQPHRGEGALETVEFVLRSFGAFGTANRRRLTVAPGRKNLALRR